MQREWLDTDYYAVLGVASDADDKEITKAYRKLARQHHPDQGGDEARFKEVSAAHDVLGDPEKRKEYDELRRLGPMAGGFAGGAPGDGAFEMRFEDLSDIGNLGDLFGGLFGRGPAGAGPRASRPMPGADLETDLHLSLEDAVGGVTVEIEVAGHPVKVRVPAGADHGQRLRVKGRGREGANGGPPGDLYVVVQVAPHPSFTRRSDDLVVEVPVSFAEAALGADVRVPTLDGEHVTVRVPAGTPSGKTFRVRGRGVPRKGRTGDLLAELVVSVPSSLTDEQRAAIEQLDALLSADPPGEGGAG